MIFYLSWIFFSTNSLYKNYGHILTKTEKSFGNYFAGSNFTVLNICTVISYANRVTFYYLQIVFFFFYSEFLLFYVFCWRGTLKDTLMFLTEYLKFYRYFPANEIWQFHYVFNPFFILTITAICDYLACCFFFLLVFLVESPDKSLERIFISVHESFLFVESNYWIL